MPWKENHTIRLVHSLPFFRNLGEVDFANILQAASIRDYPKNKPLFHIGDKADRLFIVLSGWIKLFRNTIEGREVVVALSTRGDMLGEMSMFGEVKYPLSAVAAEDTRLMEISTAKMQEKAKTDPGILFGIMKAMSREIYKLQIENEHMAAMTAPQRVGCLLLQLSADMVGESGAFFFPFDKSLAAARLGMKAETFSRALAQLRQVGVTKKSTQIHIESFYRLAQYCCGSCSAGPVECCGSYRKFCPEKAYAEGL